MSNTRRPKPSPLALQQLHRHAIQRLRPTTPDELHQWLRIVLDLDFPRASLTPGHDAPFDYLAHAFFETARPRDSVVWANRGGAKTFLAAVATMLDLVFKPGIEVRILAGSLEQSQRMHAHLRRLFERPDLTRLVDGRITERRVRLLNGSLAMVLAASHTSIRGCRPQKLRCDEIELFEPDLWQAAQLVTRSKQCGEVFVHGSVECFSTMHRAHGLMAALVGECSRCEVDAVDAGVKPEKSGAISDLNTEGSEYKTRTPARRLFRWSVVDVLARCERARKCAGCALLPECGGAAKAGRGHIAIEDAIVMKGRCSQATWEAEMLCLRARRDELVLPEFERSVHVFGEATKGRPGESDAATEGEEDTGKTWGLEGLEAGKKGAISDLKFEIGEGTLACASGALGAESLAGASGSSNTFAGASGSRADPLACARGSEGAGQLVCSMDFGFRAPTAILWARIGSDGVIRIIDERIESGVVLARHVDAILKSKWGVASWVAIDPAGHQKSGQTGISSATVLSRAGLSVRHQKSMIEEGLNLVRARLRPATGSPRLFVHARCRGLIESLERYHYPEDKPRATAPVKDGADHAVDALRYLVVNVDWPREVSVRGY